MASEPGNRSTVADRTTRSSGVVERASAWGRRLWRPLEYSSSYLALLAVMEVFVVQEVLALPASPAMAVVGLITFSVYANDRLVDLDTDAVSNPHRTAFTRQYQSVLYVMAAVAYGAAVALSVLGGPAAFALALVPGVAWILYAVSWTPVVDLPVHRLKEVLVVNSAIVAGAWSVTIVFLPLAFADAAITPAVWVLFLYLALGTFVCTEISNVRDIESDRRDGVATIPVAFGVRRTRHASYGVALLVAAMVGYAMQTGHLTTLTGIALLAGLVSLVGIVSLLGRVGSPGRLSVAAEFTRVPVFVVLVAVPVV
jgi:4-hydroxybenzoate polyprenyltransferase